MDRLALQSALESVDIANNPNPLHYTFRGYSKRILSAKERQELVGDGLTGGCAMRPLGTQVREQVWIGEGVHLADSARVIGPTYIGARTIIRAGATIGPFASVERDCVVDCGATVERSTILPGTYLASGVLIRNAVVDGGFLEDLEGGAIVDLQPASLGTRMRHPQSGIFAEVPSEAFDRSKFVRSNDRTWNDRTWNDPARNDRTWDAASAPTAARWRQVQL
jgi:carbonic anhydrase/acetyltransferase-like protein (isoleucine patch superfamily)